MTARSQAVAAQHEPCRSLEQLPPRPAVNAAGPPAECSVHALIAVCHIAVEPLALSFGVMSDVESQLLAELADCQSIDDSLEYAASHDLQPNQVVGVIKSLLAAGLVEGEVRTGECFPALELLLNL